MHLHGSAASGNVKASLAPWKVLVRASDHRQEAAQQHGGGASVAGDTLSAAEAYAITDLFFSHLLAGLTPSAPAKGTAGSMLGLAEMQTDEGRDMLLALQRVWRPHSAAAGGSGAAAAAAAAEPRFVVGAGHCSTAEGAVLLQALGVAAKRLQSASCSGTAGTSGTSGSWTAGTSGTRGGGTAVGLPYVALRRLALALLHALHEGGGRRSWDLYPPLDPEVDPAVDLQEVEACRKAVAQVRHVLFNILPVVLPLPP